MGRAARLLSALVLPALVTGDHPKDFKDQPTVAVVSVHSPAEISGNYEGIFATFSRWPLPKGDLLMRAPSDELGCVEYPTDIASQPGALGGPAPQFVSVVLRGTCTFVVKAKMAQKAGASGIIIVNSDDSAQVMGSGNKSSDASDIALFVIAMGKTQGERFRNVTLDAVKNGQAPPAMSITPYVSSLLNISELILICMATLLVALGAFFSTADVKVQEPGARDSISSLHAALAPQAWEVQEVDDWQSIGFCVVGSCFLVFLFFFMQWAIYFILFFFCIGGISCMAQFGAICLAHYFPSLRNRYVQLPLVGPIMHAEIIAGIPALIIVVSWVILRNSPYGWPLQDIIGAGFLCWLQRTLRLPNMRVACLLLSAMFFFDIFWVFISPFFFKESVMVRVATGGGTGEVVPMLLRIPAFGDPFGNDRLLGFGDIAIPGLLVSCLRRHDLLSRRKLCKGYFMPALIGYFIGLNVTIAALCIMRMGQPALLYLVPGTLGTTLVIAFCRGEVALLWNGVPAKDESSTSEDSGEEESSPGEYKGFKSSP